MLIQDITSKNSIKDILIRARSVNLIFLRKHIKEWSESREIAREFYADSGLENDWFVNNFKDACKIVLDNYCLANPEFRNKITLIKSLRNV